MQFNNFKTNRHITSNSYSAKHIEYSFCIVFSSGEHTYFYQLFIEKDEKLLLPTTQILVELSFLQGNVKLKEVSIDFE